MDGHGCYWSGYRKWPQPGGWLDTSFVAHSSFGGYPETDRPGAHRMEGCCLKGSTCLLLRRFFLTAASTCASLNSTSNDIRGRPRLGWWCWGRQGEANLLSDEETRQVLGAAIGAAVATKVMMAGVSRDSLAGTLAGAEFAAGVRYDAVVVQAPSMLRGVGASERRW